MLDLKLKPWKRMERNIKGFSLSAKKKVVTSQNLSSFTLLEKNPRVLETLWGSGFLKCTAAWRPLTSSMVIASRLSRDFLSITAFWRIQTISKINIGHNLLLLLWLPRSWKWLFSRERVIYGAECSSCLKHLSVGSLFSNFNNSNYFLLSSLPGLALC